MEIQKLDDHILVIALIVAVDLRFFLRSLSTNFLEGRNLVEGAGASDTARVTHLIPQTLLSGVEEDLHQVHMEIIDA